ncbi:MAG: hypothetical protein P8J32_05250 [bacterium]|nr:hypothetical protein [bacterium]
MNMRGEGGGPRWQPVNRDARSRRPKRDTSDDTPPALAEWKRKQEARSGQIPVDRAGTRRPVRREQPERRKGPISAAEWRAKRAQEARANSAEQQRREDRRAGLTRYERSQPQQQAEQRPQRYERPNRERNTERGPSRREQERQEQERRQEIARADRVIEVHQGYATSAEQHAQSLQGRLARTRDMQERSNLERLIRTKELIADQARQKIKEQEDRKRQLGAAA